MIAQILDFTEKNGLVICERPQTALNNYEMLYLFEIEKLRAHSVFFRRFFKTNDDLIPYKSEPVVCVFKREEVPVNSSNHLDIHSALWSEGKIDIYIIFDESRIDIYNVRKPAEKISESELSVESLKLPTDLISLLENEMSASHLFGTGTFWEQSQFQNHINLGKSPYRHLIDYLMKVRKRFLENSNGLNSETIDNILVVSILVKFLEEKKDSGTERSTLDEIYSKYQVKTLVEAVETRKFLNVLDDLATEFNGRVFDLFTDFEKVQISKANLDLLVQFLNAEKDLDTDQLFLWKQYSFQHLPAEVISAIYENFIQEDAIREGNGREKGVVYTPIHLVNFMVDEVMPLEIPPASFLENGIYRILDPTCGSGVFLVAAFKRLLQWWAIAESKRSGKISFPDSQTAQRILEKNIFGVDVKRTAVRVSIFGLTTALLDYLTPKQVWGKLKFKDLSTKNIVVAPQPTGFFQWALDAKNEKKHFSLIIGNPPFNPEKNVSKDEVLDPKIIGLLELKHPSIPRKNFALHFFEASMLLTDRICMVIPANALLYDKSAGSYRKELFTDYTISDIYDFTHLRRELFTSADTPIVALMASNQISEFQPIKHTVVKRTISVEQKVRFEIDDYDRHLVKWDWAVDPEKQFVWKTNLLGGGRLFHLIYKLSHSEDINDLLKTKRLENNEWIFQDGYKNLSVDPISPVINYLYEQDKVKQIAENGDLIIEGTLKTKYFGRPRPEGLYQLPILLIHKKTGGGSFPVGIIKNYHRKYLAFSNSFIGIHSPYEEYDALYSIFSLLRKKNRIAFFWMVSTSSNTLINQETTINKEDLVTIPLKIENFEPSFHEQIIINDVLNYYIHLGKQITKKFDGAILHHPVKGRQLEEYGEVLCSDLNDIYAENGNSWQSGKIYKMPSYTVYQIGFGVNGHLKQEFVDNVLDDSIQKLINNDTANRGAAYKRIVRLYDHVDGFDCVYFIKPNALRYWLKSIALRDADETFLDFKAENY